MLIDNLQILTGAETADQAGVYIPAGDIPGIAGAEMSDTGITLDCKLIYGFLNGIHNATTVVAPLGYPEPEKSDPSGAGANTFTEGVTVRIQRLLDLRSNEVIVLPLPTSGSYSGQGSLTIEDVFPNAAIIAQSGAASGAGVIVPHAWITSYGGTIPATVGSDGRSWFGAFVVALNHGAILRTTTVSSAITRKTDPLAIRLTGATIPAEYYDATNPKSAILPADLPFLRLIQESITVDYEMLVNPTTQTLEVNVKTL
jgi:hypothetical protein